MQATIQVAQDSKRISGLEHISEHPRIFFTLAGNIQSERVIQGLRKKYMPLNQIPCSIFSDVQEIAAYLAGYNVPSGGGVAIFDDIYENGCFSSLYRNDRLHIRRFPDWAPVLWAIALHRRISESRIETAVRQIHSDYHVNFLDRINNGELPSGKQAERDRASRYPDGWRYRSYNHSIW